MPLLDHLWIYSGILNRIPQLIETAEQSQQKIKTYQNKVTFFIDKNSKIGTRSMLQRFIEVILNSRKSYNGTYATVL